MTAHYIDYEDEFFTYLSKSEIKKILVDIFYHYPHMNLTLWRTSNRGEPLYINYL